MTVKAQVTFTKEHQVTVIGETLEEITAAAEALANSGIELDRDWDGVWDVTVFARTDIIPAPGVGHEVILLAGANAQPRPCHCGVVGDEIVHIHDYNISKGTSIPEAKD